MHYVRSQTTPYGARSPENHPGACAIRPGVQRRRPRDIRGYGRGWRLMQDPNMHAGSRRTRTQDRPLQYNLAMIIGALLRRDNSGLLVTRRAVEGRRHEGASSPGSSPYFLAVRGLVRQSVDVSSGASLAVMCSLTPQSESAEAQ